MAKPKKSSAMQKLLRGNSPKRPTPKIKGTNRRPNKARTIA